MADAHRSAESTRLFQQQHLQPILFHQVIIDDSFWSPRIRQNQERTQPLIYQLLQETWRIDALRLKWRPGDVPVPQMFWDSDVAKWIEGVSYRLATHPDPDLEQKVDEVIDLISQAQHPDGYLNS